MEAFEEDPQSGLNDVWNRVYPYRRWLMAYCGTCGFLIAVALLALWAGNGFHGLGISGHGVVAVMLGVVVSVALAIGLMALVFFSDRSGYDDTLYHLQDEAQKDAQENTDDRA
ncbi:hypothetical protein [Pelagibius sp. 7325]|uniref:hypothetical protein n=1 Tax=Pelagibius sp. 7325 TaxID=3131994 RepID=UPI0030ED4967